PEKGRLPCEEVRVSAGVNLRGKIEPRLNHRRVSVSGPVTVQVAEFGKGDVVPGEGHAHPAQGPPLSAVAVGSVAQSLFDRLVYRQKRSRLQVGFYPDLVGQRLGRKLAQSASQADLQFLLRLFYIRFLRETVTHQSWRKLHE